MTDVGERRTMIKVRFFMILILISYFDLVYYQKINTYGIYHILHIELDCRFKNYACCQVNELV